MFCRKCGSEIPKYAQFCVKCGTSVEKDIPSKLEQQPDIELEKKMSETAVTKMLDRKKASSTIPILLAVGAGISLLGGLMIFLFMDKRKEDILLKNASSSTTEKLKMSAEEVDISTYQLQIDQWKKQFSIYTLSDKLQSSYDTVLADYQIAIENKDEDSCEKCESVLEDLLSQVKQNEFRVAKIRSYYADVLTEMNYQMTRSEGEIDGITENGEYLNKYAIIDVDGDGVEELIVSIAGTCMAGMTEKVYEYDLDTETLITELEGNPSTRYYSNGAVAADWMHNQGKGLDFWPYTVYVYNTQSDTYVKKSSVDTWEKASFPDEFPEEADKDGDGVVYYLEGISDADETDEVKYKDKADYDAWYASYFGSGTEIEILWQGICNKAYESYTSIYISLLMDNIKARQQSKQIDMGLFFMENDNNYEKVEQLLSTMIQIEISEEGGNMDREGQYNGETVYYSIVEDAGGIEYCNKQIAGVTLLGMYPGMSKEEGTAILEECGFYQKDERMYCTGEAWENYSVFLDYEEGFIRKIKLVPYCAYAG